MTGVVDYLGEQRQGFPAEVNVQCALPFGRKLSFGHESGDVVHIDIAHHFAIFVVHRRVAVGVQPGIAVGIDCAVGVSL